MNGMLFSRQQPKAKDFRKHCCNVMFPHIRQQLTENMVNDLRREHQQAISFEIQSTHQEAFEAIQYKNIGLQDKIRARNQQTERWEDTITYLREFYAEHARDPGKENIFIIVQKHTNSATNKYHDLSYYISRILRLRGL